MAKSRTELDNKLHEFCANVYFQPPSSIRLDYPCLVYDLEKTDVKYADNAPYALHDVYFLKYITRDPDDFTRNQIIMLPMCSSEKVYISDNLYHHPFRLYW